MTKPPPVALESGARLVRFSRATLALSIAMWLTSGCVLWPLDEVAPEPDDGPSPWAGVSQCTSRQGAPSLGSASMPNEALVRACVLLKSCDLLFSPTVSECIRRNYPATLGRWRRDCLLSAHGCDDLLRCESSIVQDAAGLCADGSVAVHCDGKIAMRCSGEDLVFRSACPETCDLEALGDDRANSSQTPCTLASNYADLCSSPTANGTMGCHEHHQYRCIDGTAFGTDCRKSGGTCNPDGSGSCVSTSSAAVSCADLGAGWEGCRDDRLLRCVKPSGAGPVLEEYPCGSIGHRCDSPVEREADCIPEGCSWNDVESCEESCAGNMLQLCPGLSVDCSRFGFSTCARRAFRPDGPTRVACVP
jgi:hypothetical protein